MKLRHLSIKGFRNLEDITIYFDEDATVNSIIGINGSGKSNILEALSIIFAGAIRNETDVPFKFEMSYLVDENLIEINNQDDGFSISKNGKKVAKKNIFTVLPRTIFLYYAGETTRLKEIAQGKNDKKFQTKLKNSNMIDFDDFTYLSTSDFGASFLINAIYRTTRYKNICDLLNIQDICMPIILNLKRPIWGKHGDINDFWNSVGSVFKSLDYLKSKGTIKSIDKDSAQIIIEDIELLKDPSLGEMGLFAMFKVLNELGILDNIEYDVTKDDKRFSYTSLSEGEKQLATFLSVLEITKEFKTLFLLDEFDSYMHPQWQRKLMEELSKIEIRGQVLFTTHSPLTLGKMKKDNIILIREGTAYTPSSETYNRDITEVLEELMEVKKRPAEIEDKIKLFRESTLKKDVEKANQYLDELHECLSEDDPFFVGAQIALKRIMR